VLEGIKAAQDAGIAVKINAVALKGVNEDEWGHTSLFRTGCQSL
jgi:molybdenum cofactor biosynthesis enzyme MoaA